MNKKILLSISLSGLLILSLASRVFAASNSSIPIEDVINRKVLVWVGGGDMPQEILVQDYLGLQQKVKTTDNQNRVITQYDRTILAVMEEGKRKLTAERKITTQDIKTSIIKHALVRQNTINLSNGVVATTDKAGIALLALPAGKYAVEGYTVAGVDLNIQDIVFIDKTHSVVPIGIRAGSGQVRRFDSSGNVISSSNGKNKLRGSLAHSTLQIDSFDPTTMRIPKKTLNRALPGEVVKVIVFSDLNDNAKFDLNEPILPWSGVPISLVGL